jgi:hypothetical protein
MTAMKLWDGRGDPPFFRGPAGYAALTRPYFPHSYAAMIGSGANSPRRTAAASW